MNTKEDDKTHFEDKKIIASNDNGDYQDKAVKEYDQKPTPAFIIVSWLAL